MIHVLLAGAALALAASLAAPASASEPFADGEAGGGYDSNLNAAPRSSEAKGAGFGFASASLGIATDPARVRYQVAGEWSGVFYTDYSDLSVNRIALAGGLFASLSDSLVASVRPSLGGSFYGDDERDSLDLALHLALRWQLHERIALRPGYAIVYQNARSSEFDRTAHRLSLGLDADTWPGGRVYLASTLEIGQVVRYLDPPPGGGPGGSSQGDTTKLFGRSQIVDREDATITELLLEIEQSLTRRIFARASGGYSHVFTDPNDYDVFFASASLGIRWP